MSTGTDTRRRRRHLRPYSKLSWLRSVVLAYLVVCGLAMVFEKWLIFHPSRYPGGDWDAPARIGLTVEELDLTASDGVRLHGWSAPAGGERPWVLYFHGNAGNITHRVDLVKSFVDVGLSVLIIDYRGYGKSEGKPSEDGLYRDGEAAWSCLVEERGVDPGRIVLYGKSLGGGVATEMAKRHPEAGGLILESTFRSLASVGQRQYPFLPVGLLLRTRFDNLKKVSEVRVPALVIHGRNDSIIPCEEGQELYSALSGETEAEMYLVDHADHNDTWLVGGKAYSDKIRGFVLGVTE